MRRSVLVAGLFLCLSPALLGQRTAIKSPKLLPWSQQIALREQWLEKRHAMILPMMRRYGIEMWIVVNEEFHNDPLTEYIALPRPYVGNRDIFVFIDTGSEGLRKVAIVGYAEDNLRKFFEAPDDPRPADKVLPELYEKYKPNKIGLSFGATRGAERSLTFDTYNFLSEKMGAGAQEHFVPAAPLIEEYLDTRSRRVRHLSNDGRADQRSYAACPFVGSHQAWKNNSRRCAALAL